MQWGDMAEIERSCVGVPLWGRVYVSHITQSSEEDTKCPPSSLERESLTEPGAQLAASNPSNPFISILPSTGVMGTHSQAQLFTWVLGI